MTRSTVRQALDNFIGKSLDRQDVFGRTGRVNQDGTVELLVKGDHRRIHVRVDGEQGTTTAYHKNRINTQLPGLPVIMRRTHDRLTILGENEGQLAAYLAGKPYTPQPHDHGWTEITNKPATFPPDAHDHDLPGALATTEVSAMQDVTYDRGDLEDVRDRGAFLVRGATGLQGVDGWYPVHSLRFRVENDINHNDAIVMAIDGEVLAGIVVSAYIRSTVGNSWYPWNTIPLSGSDAIFDDGTNVLTMAVTALGGVTLQRTAGTATYHCKVIVWWE